MTFPQRFWAKVEKTLDPDACWLWQGATSKKRCGTRRGNVAYRPHDGSPRRYLLAHRVALWLHSQDPTGRNIGTYDAPENDPSLQACHTPACTNRLCCNPAHLYWGTREENDRDRYGLLTLALQVLREVEQSPRQPYTHGLWRPLKTGAPLYVSRVTPVTLPLQRDGVPPCSQTARRRLSSDRARTEMQQFSLFHVEPEGESRASVDRASGVEPAFHTGFDPSSGVTARLTLGTGVGSSGVRIPKVKQTRKAKVEICA